MQETGDGLSKTDRQSGHVRRLLPVAVVAGLTGLVFAFGWHKYLTLKEIGLNYDALRGFIEDHMALAILMFFAIYIAVVALSLPGAAALTLTGGLLFGWQIAGPATIVAATIGATIIFLVARTSFGEAFAARAGPSLNKLRDGFKDNALSYLLFLRLVPAFPFVVVNLAAAVLGVPLKTYVLGTFIGIIPGTMAFTFAGSGLGSVVRAQNDVYKACLARQAVDQTAGCTYSIDTSALMTKELLIAFAVLGVVALLPVAIKMLKSKGRPET